MAKPKGRVILFPSLLAPGATDDVLPRRNLELLRQVRFFVVEELRSARRFLKHCHRDIDIDALSFEVLNEHTAAEEVAAMLQPALEGHDIGVISEAGCPAVADPGSDLVAVAQERGVKVVPLVGPSSILMALMGSGLTDSRLPLTAICLTTDVPAPKNCARWNASSAHAARLRYLSRPPIATTVS